MRIKIIYLWNKLHSSFWFVPLLLIAGGILLAYTTIRVDSWISWEPEGLERLFFSGTANSAQIVLSTIAGAMIGVAGTVFSITLVALTLASSQLGPRLLRNFMHDTLNQSVLGIYVSTFLYCLLILRTVNAEESYNYVPNISVGVAIVLALLNIILLVIFIHHISVSIQADRVIASISSSLAENIDKIFLENRENRDNISEEEISQHLSSRKTIVHVSPSKSGYIQAIDNDQLRELAYLSDIVIRMKYKPGDFVVKESELAAVFSDSEPPAKTLNAIRDNVMISNTRTPTQDIEFAILQMVEVAGRALSPGINDPFTAITCIDHLGAIVSKLSRAVFPGNVYLDRDKNVRLIVHPPNFAGILDAAFNQIRQYASNNPAILIRLLEAFKNIMRSATSPEHKKAVMRHGEMCINLGKETVVEKGDLEDIEERYRELRNIYIKNKKT